MVSNTSPLNYLVLIGQAQILERLYGRVLIPSVVRDELLASETPAQVREWITSPPPWSEIRNVVVGKPEATAGLDADELAAMDLAVSAQADLVLMDLRARQEATRRGLKVTGFIGILTAATVVRTCRHPHHPGTTANHNQFSVQSDA